MRIQPVKSRNSGFEIATMLRFFLSEQRRRWSHAAARRFARDARGNFAIMFAFTAPVLIVFIGMGVDYLVALSDKSRMDTAADAAAIAAVNSAVAYYKLNPKNETGTTLKNDAITAGKAQALSVFNVNMGATQVFATAQLNGPVIPTIDICDAATPACGPLTFNSSVTWSGKIAAHFGPLVNITNIGIAGSSGATAGLNAYIDFYVMVDTSGSMGIPTNTSDQPTNSNTNQLILIANNPDNAREAQAGYTGGCQFACHFDSQGYLGYTYVSTPATYLPLKITSAASAILALVNQASTTEATVNQPGEFRIGLYPFIVDATVASPEAGLSSNFGTITQTGTITNLVTPTLLSPQPPLANYLDDGGIQFPKLGSGGTHFENLWADMTGTGVNSTAYLQTPGTGLSSTSTLPVIILVTDGVDNSQTYINDNFSGSYPQTPNLSFCTNAKNLGYTVAVILVPYITIADPLTIWNDEDGVVNNLIATNAITPVMESCASTGYFFSAATTDDISAAMVTIFKEAVSTSRITQ
jgi:Flp pilus assembly protein TadG